MPDEMWAALDAEAKRTGQSMGEHVRQAVTLYLAFRAIVGHSGDVETLATLIANIERLAEAPGP
jgi:hypothetical protein